MFLLLWALTVTKCLLKAKPNWNEHWDCVNYRGKGWLCQKHEKCLTSNIIFVYLPIDLDVSGIMSTTSVNKAESTGYFFSPAAHGVSLKLNNLIPLCWFALSLWRNPRWGETFGICYSEIWYVEPHLLTTKLS